MFGEFDTLDLVQRSDEWLRWRAGGLGASETGCLTGLDPFKTEGDLTHAKLSLTLRGFQNSKMQRGAALEPEALAAYVERRGIAVRPACIQSKTNPWMRASLDGLSIPDCAAVEIKCGHSTYNYVSRSGRLPDTAYAQMQHIMAITGFEKMDFWCYEVGRRPILQSLYSNSSYIRRLVEKSKEFWDFIGPTVESKLRAQRAN